jgi:ubiquinone/menaquinone biosynthesis C-methylase UbiE
VDVEQPRAARLKGLSKRVDRRPVAPLGEVRDGLERPRHARSLGSVKTYYDRRAPEYDEWYRGAGRFAERERAGWEQEVEALGLALAALRPARTLDVACGTGYLTRHLPGEIVGLDQSEAMLEEARRQAPSVTYVQGDALSLPFEDGAFERIFTAHFYGHLEGEDRERFVAEARRLAPELVVVDSALRDDVEAEEWQERILNDGSCWEVYKRYFEAHALARELGGGETVFAGRRFVAVRS